MVQLLPPSLPLAGTATPYSSPWILGPPAATTDSPSEPLLCFGPGFLFPRGGRPSPRRFPCVDNTCFPVLTPIQGRIISLEPEKELSLALLWHFAPHPALLSSWAWLLLHQPG